MRHVRNVHPQPPLLGRNLFQTNRVVKILRVVGINRDDVMRAAIQPPGQIFFVNRRANRVRLGEHGFGKMQRQIILAQHGQHIHALRIGRAEHLDDFTLGITVARFPFAQFDDDLVAEIRLPTHVARRRHIDIVWNARVVGNDVEKLFALRQRADDLCALAFENADNRAVFLIAVAKVFASRIAAHQHAVFVQSRASRTFGDGNLFDARVIWLEKSAPRPVHADASRN